MIIYKTTNLINAKFYIGKDEKNNPLYLGSGIILNRAIKKYGKNNFKKEILEICTDSTHLCEREIFWIKELNSIVPNGYNITNGGTGGDTFSNSPNKEKTRRKLSITSKNKIWTIESKEKSSKSRKELLKNNPYSKELKEQIQKTLFEKKLPVLEIQHEIIKLYLNPWNKIEEIRKKYKLTILLFYYILKIHNIVKIKRYSYQTVQFTKDTELNICTDYTNNISLRNLNKKYNIGTIELKRILTSNNIQIKQSGFKTK